jgi:uncharacterized membrane protein YebE (DUF533 family)
MSYGDIVGRLLNEMTNKGKARLKYMADSNQSSTQSTSKWMDLIEKFVHSKQAGNLTGGQLGGIGALAGALLGGGASVVKGALGGSALSMLGAMAINALQKKYGDQPSDLQKKEAAHSLPKEQLERETAHSLPKEQLQAVISSDTEKLILRAMINAAKADGQLDQSEMDKIMGKVNEDGITDEERQFIHNELIQQMDLDKLVSSIPNQIVATQVYAASLFAIDIDTEAEKAYLRQLAHSLKLDSDTVRSLHEMTGSPII